MDTAQSSKQLQAKIFEVVYSTIYPDVASFISQGGIPTCIYHYQQFGIREDRVSPTITRHLFEAIDFDWYREKYNIDGNSFELFKHYFSNASKNRHSPSAKFNEEVFFEINNIDREKLSLDDAYCGLLYYLRYHERQDLIISSIESDTKKHVRRASGLHMSLQQSEPISSRFEDAYKILYPDIADAIQRRHFKLAIDHYETAGKSEKRISPDDVEMVFNSIDFDWYSKQYAVRGSKDQLFIHYLIHSKREHHSPNAQFDEENFLIDNDLSNHCTHSGFITFLRERQKRNFHVISVEQGNTRRILRKLNEKKEQLDAFMPGLAEPIGIERVKHFNEKIDPAIHCRHHDIPARLNVLVPHLAPEIFFGGYGALFQFCAWLQKNGVLLRFIVTEQAARNNVLQILLSFNHLPLAYNVLKSADIQFLPNSNAVDISSNDSVLCYSMWTAFVGKKIINRCSGKLFYFIQEYEPSFHAYGSYSFLGASVLSFDHIPIFNSKELMQYFQSKRIGAFHSDNGEKKPFFYFQHVIPKIALDSSDSINNRNIRKLLFYARPEAHAERNIFEVGVLALSKAIEQKVFGEEWEFYGIGTLASQFSIDLPDGRKLHCVSKVPADEYYRYLTTFDVGMSFIYAPHPGVVHFEMAAAGMAVVTNTFENRSAAHLKAISSNIIPCECTLDGIVDALRQAVLRAKDGVSRHNGSQLNLPVSWEAAFSPMSELINLL